MEPIVLEGQELAEVLGAGARKRGHIPHEPGWRVVAEITDKGHLKIFFTYDKKVLEETNDQ